MSGPHGLSRHHLAAPRRTSRGLALALLGLAALIAPSARGDDLGDKTRVDRTRYLMGTVCTATVESPDTASAARAIDVAFGEIARLEQVMSSWLKDSELARLNAVGGGAWFPCSRDLYAVIDSSMRYARLTSGAFDPTIEAYNVLWNVRGKGRLPKPEEIESAQIRVGFRKLNFDHDARRLLFPFSDMGLDLGGIGKGYALDVAARVLARAGIERALLNFGGEVLAMGGGWPVKVASPADRLRAAIGITASNAAVSTSSQSERGVVVKKKRYGHIFDPRTGRPVEGSASVSVVANSATRADAISTALLVMGREGASTFAEAHADLGVLWLEPDGPTVRAWKWNLPGLQAEPGINVEWMN